MGLHKQLLSRSRALANLQTSLPGRTQIGCTKPRSAAGSVRPGRQSVGDFGPVPGIVARVGNHRAIARVKTRKIEQFRFSRRRSLHRPRCQADIPRATLNEAIVQRCGDCHPGQRIERHDQSERVAARSTSRTQYPVSADPFAIDDWCTIETGAYNIQKALCQPEVGSVKVGVHDRRRPKSFD
jgi:hypothetical protein